MFQEVKQWPVPSARLFPAMAVLLIARNHNSGPSVSSRPHVPVCLERVSRSTYGEDSRHSFYLELANGHLPRQYCLSNSSHNPPGQALGTSWIELKSRSRNSNLVKLSSAYRVSSFAILEPLRHYCHSIKGISTVFVLACYFLCNTRSETVLRHLPSFLRHSKTCIYDHLDNENATAGFEMAALQRRQQAKRASSWFVEAQTAVSNSPLNKLSLLRASTENINCILRRLRYEYVYSS